MTECCVLLAYDDLLLNPQNVYQLDQAKMNPGTTLTVTKKKRKTLFMFQYEYTHNTPTHTNRKKSREKNVGKIAKANVTKKTTKFV